MCLRLSKFLGFRNLLQNLKQEQHLLRYMNFGTHVNESMPHGHVIHLRDRRKELPEESYLQKTIINLVLFSSCGTITVNGTHNPSNSWHPRQTRVTPNK